MLSCRLSSLILLLVLFACQQSPSTTASDSAQTDQPTIPATDSFLIRHEAEILAFEESDRKQKPLMGFCLFTGSSSVRLWRTLARDLSPLPVLNRGFGGSTFRELTHYFDRLVSPYRPKMIVVYEGDNDIVDPNTSPADVLASLDTFRMKRDERFPHTTIYMLAIKPSPSRRVLLPKARETNALFQAYCDTARNVEYLDVFTPIMTHDSAINGLFFTGDSLHMNQEGYDAWSEVIRAPLLERYAQ